jgi:type II secretory pathway pseudopilin PulG
VALVLLALALSACGPRLPKGVDADKLDQAVSDAIGGAQTCMLIGRKGSGEVVWRYNTHTTCARTLPACDGPGQRTVGDLLKATAKDGQPRTLSCNSAADGSRGVGWASGAVPNHDLVWAAVMEGDRALPGRLMAEDVAGALQDAGF